MEAGYENNKIKGEVRFPPYEDLDEAASKEAAKFQVHPLGAIASQPRHIPYNSEKKDFLGKTGREGFEGKHSDVAVGSVCLIYGHSIPLRFQGSGR
jgi:hypothetical protein